MVFKNFSRIKTALPELIHIVIFYNSGTMFQTTFEKDINIPKLGGDLADLIYDIKLVYDIGQFEMINYKKLILEPNDPSNIFLKLGEESYITQFFKREEEKDLKLSSITRYITRIETLIIMGEEEIILDEILSKEEEIQKVRKLLQSNLEKIHITREELKNVDKSDGLNTSKHLEKEIFTLNEDCIKFEKEITDIQE